MKDSFFSFYSGQNIASFHPELDVRQFLLPNSERKTASFLQRWTKISFFSPTPDKRQFLFIQSWMKDSFLSSYSGQKTASFIQSWMKDSFYLSNSGQKTVSFHSELDERLFFFALLVWKKFLEPMIYVFVFGQSFLSEYFSINEFS